MKHGKNFGSKFNEVINVEYAKMKEDLYDQ
jgi:hypothetical protein